MALTAGWKGTRLQGRSGTSPRSLQMSFLFDLCFFFPLWMFVFEVQFILSYGLKAEEVEDFFFINKFTVRAA